MKTNQVDLHHLLSAMDSAVVVQSNGVGSGLRVELEERELWGKFKELTNEMIVTKTGR